MYVEFKEGQKFASKIADQSPMHEAFNDAGYCLTENDLIVDVDCLPKETIEKLIQVFDIKTQIVWTDRGVHMYFEKPNGFRGARAVCPLGFDVEYKHVSNTKAITIKRNGKLRDIENIGVRKPLPNFLFTRKKLDSLLGLDEGDGRNQKLYAHKFQIMSVKNYKKVLSFINSYIFATPLEPDEFQTVIREEQIKAERDCEYDVAMALKNKLKVVKFDGNLYCHNGTRFVTGDEFVNAVSKHLQGQKTRYIKEVIEQMEFHIINSKRPAHGWDVKLKNGILRNGKWIEIDSQEFTPHYVDVEYDPDAEPVAEVDDYLNFLSDGDADYRKLIIQVLASTLITNPDTKRQIAKFFFLIGDGQNGKGTFLTVINRILGGENCSTLSPEEMTKEQYFTMIVNKLANLGDDVEDKPINEKQMKVLKNISTCDNVSSRELYKQASQVVVTATLIFTSNHLLKSFEKGFAYKRRVVWMPIFGKPPEKDPRFIEKLTTLEALQYWMKMIVEEYVNLSQTREIIPPTKVADYNHEYHEENNGTLIYVRDHVADDFIGMKSPEVYDLYKTWAEENGVTVQSKRVLKETLEIELGIVIGRKKVNGSTARVYMMKDEVTK